MKFLILIAIIFQYEQILCELTPLDEYVFDDSDKSIVNTQVINIKDEANFTQYKLNITTLKWFNESFSTGSIWYHDMYITVPKKLDSNKPIFYFIDSGNNNEDDKGNYVEYVSKLSADCNCVTVSQRQVPNQPFQYLVDPLKKSRREDDSVAFSFNLFLNQKHLFPNKTYYHLPLLMPMTKSVKRGMDIVAVFLKDLKLVFNEKFVVSGISKRGWTAWLITAVDPRVVACVPIVFDLVNWNKNFHIHYMSMGGGYSFALFDYYSNGLTLIFDDYNFFQLTKLVDPYYYMDRYKDKKFMVISATNDEFMMPENSKFFWTELSIQTNDGAFIRRLANSGHYLIYQEAYIFSNIKNFLFLFSQDGNAFPKLAWKFSNNFFNGKIDVSLTNLNQFESYEIKGYSAFTLNDKKIDFRKQVFDGTKIVSQTIPWQAEFIERKNLLTTSIKQTYMKNRYNSKYKYTGFYVEISLYLKNQTQDPFVLSTNINIIPEYYPVGDCKGQECFGKIL